MSSRVSDQLLGVRLLHASLKPRALARKHAKGKGP